MDKRNRHGNSPVRLTSPEREYVRRQLQIIKNNKRAPKQNSIEHSKNDHNCGEKSRNYKSSRRYRTAVEQNTHRVKSSTRQRPKEYDRTRPEGSKNFSRGHNKESSRKNLSTSECVNPVRRRAIGHEERDTTHKRDFGPYKSSKNDNDRRETGIRFKRAQTTTSDLDCYRNTEKRFSEKRNEQGHGLGKDSGYCAGQNLSVGKPRGQRDFLHQQMRINSCRRDSTRIHNPSYLKNPPANTEMLLDRPLPEEWKRENSRKRYGTLSHSPLTILKSKKQKLDGEEARSTSNESSTEEGEVFSSDEESISRLSASKTEAEWMVHEDEKQMGKNPMPMNQRNSLNLRECALFREQDSPKVANLTDDDDKVKQKQEICESSEHEQNSLGIQIETASQNEGNIVPDTIGAEIVIDNEEKVDLLYAFFKHDSPTVPDLAKLRNNAGTDSRSDQSSIDKVGNSEEQNVIESQADQKSALTPGINIYLPTETKQKQPSYTMSTTTGSELEKNQEALSPLGREDEISYSCESDVNVVVEPQNKELAGFNQQSVTNFENELLHPQNDDNKVNNPQEKQEPAIQEDDNICAEFTVENFREELAYLENLNLQVPYLPDLDNVIADYFNDLSNPESNTTELQQQWRVEHSSEPSRECCMPSNMQATRVDCEQEQETEHNHQQMPELTFSTGPEIFFSG